jgi:hypothetical protein
MAATVSRSSRSARAARTFRVPRDPVGRGRLSLRRGDLAHLRVTAHHTAAAVAGHRRTQRPSGGRCLARGGERVGAGLGQFAARRGQAVGRALMIGLQRAALLAQGGDGRLRALEAGGEALAVWRISVVSARAAVRRRGSAPRATAARSTLAEDGYQSAARGGSP